MSKKCGCTTFVYANTKDDHVPQTPCRSCGHLRRYHEDYLDSPVPCVAQDDGAHTNKYETLDVMADSRIPPVTHRIITTPSHIHLSLWVNGASAGGLCVRTDEAIVIQTITTFLKSREQENERMY